MTGIDSPKSNINSFKIENTNTIDNKSTIKNEKAEPENSKTNTTFTEPDKSVAESPKASKHNPSTVSFDNNNIKENNSTETEGSTSINHNENINHISNPDMEKIQEFVAKIKDQTLGDFLKSFDQMLENARKMMEENKKYLKEKVIPKQESDKQALVEEAVRLGKPTPANISI